MWLFHNGRQLHIKSRQQNKISKLDLSNILIFTSVSRIAVNNCFFAPLYTLCKIINASFCRSEWYGLLSWQTHLWPLEPPEGMSTSFTWHGKYQPSSVPTSGPSASEQGTVGPHVTLDWLIQEDLYLGHQYDRHCNWSTHHSASHSPHCRRLELYLLVLERFF